jgi:hypothetical protein
MFEWNLQLKIHQLCCVSHLFFLSTLEFESTLLPSLCLASSLLMCQYFSSSLHVSCLNCLAIRYEALVLQQHTAASIAWVPDFCKGFSWQWLLYHSFQGNSIQLHALCVPRFVDWHAACFVGSIVWYHDLALIQKLEAEAYCSLCYLFVHWIFTWCV